MKPNAAKIVADPEWLAHRYDEQHDAFHYRHVPRSRHATVPFATDECLGVEPDPVILARDQAAQLNGRLAPLHFIFHSAFCASTMLVRALDVPGSAMGLSEPVILNDMVGWRRRGAEPRFHGRVLDDSLSQLARPFGAGEAVVVKPSNIFNGLAIGALTIRPASKAVLLYSPLEEFLISVAGKGMWCRLWARELLEGMLKERMVDLGFEPRDYFRQTDLQVAGIGWLAQHALFHRMIAHFGSARLATLDSETLTGDPPTSVARVAAHFELSVHSRADYADHPAILRNSKSGDDFAPGERQSDQRRTREAHADEIEKVAEWVRVVGERQGIPLELPLSLA